MRSINNIIKIKKGVVKMYKIKFNLEEFLTGRVAIRCLDEYEANTVLYRLQKEGFTWADGEYVGIKNQWNKYEYDSCYRCIRADGRILGINKQFDITTMGCKTILADRLSFNMEDIPKYKVFQIEQFLDKRLFIHCATVEESQKLIDIISLLLPNVYKPKAIANTCYNLRTSEGKYKQILSPDGHQGMKHSEFGDEVIVEFKDLAMPIMAWKGFKMDKVSLGYELGVMMFHAYNNKYKIDQATEGYNIVGNFESLCHTIQNKVDSDDLQRGFLAEAENMGVAENIAQQTFQEFYQKLFD